MRAAAAVVGVLIAAAISIAANQPTPEPVDLGTMQRVPCDFVSVAYDWDFSVNDQGFTTSTCDATGGDSVWEWGTTSSVPGAPGAVWATVLDGDYPSNSGEGLLSPPFACNGDQDVMEIVAWVDIEQDWDGGNVTVNDTVITPVGGYPGTLNPDAYCVGGEEAFTGIVGTWQHQCFDLSAYWGQTIQVRFDFGADSEVTALGWYLASVKIGDDFIPVELQAFTAE